MIRSSGVAALVVHNISYSTAQYIVLMPSGPLETSKASRPSDLTEPRHGPNPSADMADRRMDR